MRFRKVMCAACASIAYGICVSGSMSLAAAAEDASKPIRFVVPFAAAGGTDLLTRLVGQKLTEMTGRPVVVDNRPGASGIVEAEIVAKAPPDGNTLMMILSSHVIN